VSDFDVIEFLIKSGLIAPLIGIGLVYLEELLRRRKP
jgi:hypothetical protein